MLTWPHPHGDWAPALDAIESLYLELAALILRYERLLLVCYDQAHLAHVQTRLRRHCPGRAEAVRFAVVPSNDSWSRDHGPLSVLDGERAVLLDFQFNGWGGKYPAELDNRITAALCEQGVIANPCRDCTHIVLEGGSIDTDGAGTLLTTSRCLLSPTRNARMERDDWQRLFARHMGIERTLWLDEGELLGDDTDGHIDMLARFCSAATIAYTSCERRDDPQYQSLAKMEQQLRTLRRADGQPYELVPLPVPAPRHDEQGQRLPASYANFLIINGAVLVPVYGAPEDAIALERLAHCFPDRRIHGVNCEAAIAQHGSLHCLTMQLPREVAF